MDDSQESRLSKQNRQEEAETLESNPVAQALCNLLEKDEPVRVCQLMSELSRLAEEEQAAEDEEREP